MYDKENGYFKLSVRNLNSGSLCSKPQADRVSNLAWAKDGQALLYVVTDKKMRPYRWVERDRVTILLFWYLCDEMEKSIVPSDIPKLKGE
jgi:hypothetical protein